MQNTPFRVPLPARNEPDRLRSFDERRRREVLLTAAVAKANGRERCAAGICGAAKMRRTAAGTDMDPWTRRLLS